jgi:hypothetical protein
VLPEAVFLIVAPSSRFWKTSPTVEAVLKVALVYSLVAWVQLSRLQRIYRFQYLKF